MKVLFVRNCRPDQKVILQVILFLRLEMFYLNKMNIDIHLSSSNVTKILGNRKEQGE